MNHCFLKRAGGFAARPVWISIYFGLLRLLVQRLPNFSLPIAIFEAGPLPFFTSVLTCGALLELVSLAIFFFDALAIGFFLGCCLPTTFNF
jgi:hypothetical protein